MNRYMNSLQDLGMEGGARLEPPPSVLHELNLANRRLEKLLGDLRNERNADADLRNIAREVVRAVELNPDVALACLFLNQIAGTYAVRHCIETAIVVVLVARGMDKASDEVISLTAAALTMNVGMIRHHDNFQSKPGLLNSEEMAIVRRHPEDSAEMLKYAGVEDDEWLSCVLMHHENDDGTGYPSGITRDQISHNARLLSLADRYCARVSARNYRCSMLPDEALDKLLHDPAHPADPELQNQFHRQVGRFPPGALVRLANGELGVVTCRDNGDGVLEVHCMRDAAGKTLPASVHRRTNEPDCAIHQALTEDQAELRFSMKQIWGAQAAL
ncbi:HD-GYP domain-containing protein [Pseudoduganella violaceinigra]|uniref:HD-GYP domain-containing protein n=1 Tax=Pseudoduganella violaceinigra TaxID=246602 RepID=UPI0003F9B888|nr:HD domain-containing phosphohydrolase [Pseudoduganella violaceinigra]